uniref:Transmembrane protein n=1 Tax=Steinernema glaseri TaxID=37863 RepID=A0A1I8A9R1_9BILA
MYLSPEQSSPSVDTFNVVFLGAYFFLFVVIASGMGFFFYTTTVSLRQKVAALNAKYPFEDEVTTVSTVS